MSKYRKPTKAEIKNGMENGWSKKDCERGFAIFERDGALEIQAIGDVFTSIDSPEDEACAREAERTGFCKIIPVDELPENMEPYLRYFGWVDTPKNRKTIAKNFCSTAWLLIIHDEEYDETDYRVYEKFDRGLQAWRETLTELVFEDPSPETIMQIVNKKNFSSYIKDAIAKQDGDVECFLEDKRTHCAYFYGDIQGDRCFTEVTLKQIRKEK